jgi:hypothetical protein
MVDGNEIAAFPYVNETLEAVVPPWLLNDSVHVNGVH